MLFEQQFWDKYDYLQYCSGRRGYFPVFMTHPNNKTMLKTYVVGEEALRLEQIDPEALKDEIQAILSGMYPDKKNKTNHRPVQVHITKWCGNEAFGGVDVRLVKNAFADGS